MINGKIGEFSRNEERAIGTGHKPVLASVSFNSVGQLSVGRLITKTAMGAVPLVVAENEVLATGNGTISNYSGFLGNSPIEPGNLTITDGTESFIDDGCGNLFGSDGGTGSIRYDIGEFSINFNNNVNNGIDVTASYITSFYGVIDEDLNTDYSSSALCVIHGSVKENVLKIDDAGTAPGESVLKVMTKKGVYAQ
jgi:hypothetical protein